MQIQSIKTTNRKNTSFGLKLSSEVAAGIIEEYKKYGAKDSEIAYYLRTIQKSAPDTFTLVKNNTQTSVDCHYDGDNRVIKSDIKVQKNDGTFIDEKSRDVYPYNDPESPDLENPYNYNAENKVFFAEHLVKTVKSAVEKLQVGEYDGISDKSAKESNFDQYNYLIEMSKKWPQIPMD